MGRSLRQRNASGNAYIAGQTSASFPTNAGALQTVAKGGGDCFVAKLNATATGLVYSTMLGGSSGDLCRSIAVDSVGVNEVEEEEEPEEKPAKEKE